MAAIISWQFMGWPASWSTLAAASRALSLLSWNAAFFAWGAGFADLGIVVSAESGALWALVPWFLTFPCLWDWGLAAPFPLQGIVGRRLRGTSAPAASNSAVFTRAGSVPASSPA